MVRALLARLGCDRITVKKTGPNVWSFEGSFDAGRIVDAKPYPETPSLIETDARGYLLNIAPSSPREVPFFSVLFRGSISGQKGRILVP